MRERTNCINQQNNQLLLATQVIGQPILVHAGLIICFRDFFAHCQ